jgi:hypothetical protein
MAIAVIAAKIETRFMGPSFRAPTLVARAQEWLGDFRRSVGITPHRHGRFMPNRPGSLAAAGNPLPGVAASGGRRAVVLGKRRARRAARYFLTAM